METDAGHVVTQVNQLCGIGKRKRLKQHVLDYGEDGAVRTYADRQRENGNGGEARGLAEHAQTQAQIACEVLNPVHAARVPAFLLGLLDTAQVESRAAVRLFLRYPLRYIFLGFSFEVVAQLVG